MSEDSPVLKHIKEHTIYSRFETVTDIKVTIEAIVYEQDNLFGVALICWAANGGGDIWNYPIPSFHSISDAIINAHILLHEQVYGMEDQSPT